MRSTHPKLRWPDLPDEAVVALNDLLMDFLLDFVERFESHYGGQIRRYHQSREREYMREPPQSDPDELSF